jgi:hypothetical protein
MKKAQLPFNYEIEERLKIVLPGFGCDEVRKLMVEYAEARISELSVKKPLRIREEEYWVDSANNTAA